MRTRYLRTEPGKRETWSAAAVSLAVAAGVGAVTFYLTRLILAREAIRLPVEAESEDVVRS